MYIFTASVEHISMKNKGDIILYVFLNSKFTVYRTKSNLLDWKLGMQIWENAIKVQVENLTMRMYAAHINATYFQPYLQLFLYVLLEVYDCFMSPIFQ